MRTRIAPDRGEMRWTSSSRVARGRAGGRLLDWQTAPPNPSPKRPLTGHRSDAYVYFYPLISMDVTRRQLTNVEADKVPLHNPDEHVCHMPGLPFRRHESGRQAQLRYALFQRMARSDQRAHDRFCSRHPRPLLPDADVGHVDYMSSPRRVGARQATPSATSPSFRARLGSRFARRRREQGGPPEPRVCDRWTTETDLPIRI